MLNIYVNSWGNYNNGGAGAWISLPMDGDMLSETLGRLADRMGDNSPEWTAQAHEWSGADYGAVSEYENIFAMNSRLLGLSELDEYEREEVAAAMEGYGYDLEEAMERQAAGLIVLFDCETLRDFAERDVEEMGLPEFAVQYFDFEAYARDLEINGYRETSKGVVYDTHGRA